MNIQVASEVGGFIFLVGGIVYNAAYLRGQNEQIEKNLTAKLNDHVEQNSRDFMSVRQQMEKQWMWKDSHERENANMRLETQRQISKLETGLSLQDGHYAEILRLIESMHTSMATKIDKLENSLVNISERINARRSPP